MKHSVFLLPRMVPPLPSDAQAGPPACAMAGLPGRALALLVPAKPMGFAQQQGIRQSAHARGCNPRLLVCVALLVLPLMLLAGCDQEPATASRQAPAQSASAQAAFAADLQARRQLQAIRAELDELGYVTSASIEALAALDRQYPGTPPIIATFDQALRALGDWDGLVALHQQTPPEERTPYQTFYLGWLLNKAQRYAEAEEVLRPLAKASPDDPQILLQLAISLSQQGRYEQAAALLDRQWEQVLRLGRHDALTIRGMAYYDAGEYEAARRMLSEVVAKDPDATTAHYYLSRTHLALGDAEKARHYLEQTHRIRERTKQVNAWSADAMGLGVAWRAQRLEQCLFYLNRMIGRAEALDAQAMLYHMRGRVHHAAGRSREAQEDLRQSRALSAQLEQTPPETMSPAAAQLLKRASTLLR